VPALVAGIAGLGLGPRSTAAVLLTLAVAAVLWFPILLPLYDGLGGGALVPSAMLLAIFFTAVAPLFLTAPVGLRRALPAIALLASLISLGIGVTAEPVSKESPRWQNILLHQDGDTGRTRWIVLSRRLPESYRKAAAFTREPELLYPWSPPRARFPVAPAPPLGAPAPQLTVLADTATAGRRHVRLRLTSPRGATAANLILPEEAQLQSIRIEGVEVPYPKGKPAAFLGRYEVAVLTLPKEGVEMDLVLGNPRPLDGYIFDRSLGLPPAGDALRRARPATAVTFQEGDTTVVSRKVRI
jgi:hypothetical protein